MERKTRAETAQDTALRLIATARRMLATEGVSKVSLDVLAAEAGVTRGALHHHFTNRTGLFEAVFRAEVRELGRRLDTLWEADLAAGADRWAAFRRIFHAYLDAVLEPGPRRILLLDGPSVLGETAVDILLDDGFGPMVEDLRGMIASGRVRSLDPVAMAHLFNGATINLAFWAAEEAVDTSGREARQSRAHAVLDAMFEGFATP